VVIGPPADRIPVIPRIARVLARRADVGRQRTPIRPDLAPDALVLQELQRAPWYMLEREPAGFKQRAAREPLRIAGHERIVGFRNRHGAGALQRFGRIEHLLPQRRHRRRWFLARRNGTKPVATDVTARRRFCGFTRSGPRLPWWLLGKSRSGDQRERHDGREIRTGFHRRLLLARAVTFTPGQNRAVSFRDPEHATEP